jgi:hypothetical protein
MWEVELPPTSLSSEVITLRPTTRSHTFGSLSLELVEAWNVQSSVMGRSDVVPSWFPVQNAS